MSEHVLIDKKLTKKELLEERLNILNMLIETNEEDKMEERIIKFIEINKENEKTNIEYVNGIYKEILDLKSDLVNYDAIKKYNIKDIKELSILKKEETFNHQKCTEIRTLISCEKNAKNKEILHNELRDLHNKQRELQVYNGVCKFKVSLMHILYVFSLVFSATFRQKNDFLSLKGFKLL